MPEIRENEVIQLAREQFAKTAEKTLKDIGDHAACNCDAAPGSSHSVSCPISVWHQAARAVRLLAEED